MKRNNYSIVLAVTMITFMSNLNCVLVFDKKEITSSSPSPEALFFSNKNIKHITDIDMTQIKTKSSVTFMFECNTIVDSVTVPDFLSFGRTELFHLTSSPCGGCPTGYVDIEEHSDTLVYTISLTDSCIMKCNPYHLFITGSFHRFQFIKKREIITVNQVTDTIESTIKNSYNWYPTTQGHQAYRDLLEE